MRLADFQRRMELQRAQTAAKLLQLWSVVWLQRLVRRVENHAGYHPGSLIRSRTFVPCLVTKALFLEPRLRTPRPRLCSRQRFHPIGTLHVN